jgi:hypothetical protein
MNKPQSQGATEIEALSGLTSRIIGAAIEVDFNSRLLKDGLKRLAL